MVADQGNNRSDNSRTGDPAGNVTTATPLAALNRSIRDEHSVLPRQTCAYDAMLDFLHYRLPPYLSEEERQLPATRLRDEHLTQPFLADHERLRADVDNIEGSRIRRLLNLATGTLVDRLDHHVRREPNWIRGAAGMTPEIDNLRDWALPLLIGDKIDLEALPPITGTAGAGAG